MRRMRDGGQGAERCLYRVRESLPLIASVPYAMLPLPHIDAALKEMERRFDQLGCVGVNMNIVCLSRSIPETEFEPIYAEINRRGAVLFVHPAGSGICSPFIVYYNYRGSVGTSLEHRSKSPDPSKLMILLPARHCCFHPLHCA
jgi:hypothetical protein